MDIAGRTQALTDLRKYLSEGLFGCDDQVRMVLAALISHSHVIIEGPPGSGKTVLINRLCDNLGLKRVRIHCTSESSPSDLASVLENAVCDVLIVDEINRAAPGFQAALLEVMEDRVFHRGSTELIVPSHFTVVATQSGSGNEGTFPLPEVQLDRFGLVIRMRNLSTNDLLKFIDVVKDTSDTIANPYCDLRELQEFHKALADIVIPERVGRVLVESVVASSPEAATAPDVVKRYVKNGAGVRAVQTLARVSRALALIEGHAEVTVDDVRDLISPALTHRLTLNFAGFANAIASNSILEAIKHRFL